MEKTIGVELFERNSGRISIGLCRTPVWQQEKNMTLRRGNTLRDGLNTYLKEKI